MLHWVMVKDNTEGDKAQLNGSYPSPGTSLSLSPSAWSWLEKLTNSAPSSQSWGRFLRSFTMARRAARSSLLRSSSLFLLLRTGLGVCFLDMLAAVVSVDQQHQSMSSYSDELALASTTATHLEPVLKKTQHQRWRGEYVKRFVFLDHHNMPTSCHSLSLM